MLLRNIRHFIGGNNLLLQILVGSSCGLLLGIATSLFSPLPILVAFGAGFFVYATLKRPELGLLAILVTTSSIVFEDQLPLIPIGIGSLYIPDIILLSLFGLLIVRWLVEPGFRFVRTPLDLPLLFFYGAILLSTFLAVYQSYLEASYAMRAIRGVSYYLTFFIVTNLIREERQLRVLGKGLFFLATIVALAMVAQFVSGQSVRFIPGRIETLSASGQIYNGVTRMLPPGYFLLIVTFIIITAQLTFIKFKTRNVLTFFQWISIGMGILFTFLRSYWAVIGIEIFILAYISRGEIRRRLIGWGLIVIIMILALVPLVMSQSPDSQVTMLVRGSLERLGSLGGAIAQKDSSLQFRDVENKYALTQIIDHPLLGIGVSTRYRPYDPRLDYVGRELTRFMHNGHLRVLMSSGLLGYIGMMWLSISFLVRGFRYWREIPDSQMRGVVLGNTLAYLGLMIAAVVNSTYFSWISTTIIGIIMGVNEIVLRQFKQ